MCTCRSKSRKYGILEKVLKDSVNSTNNFVTISRFSLFRAYYLEIKALWWKNNINLLVTKLQTEKALEYQHKSNSIVWLHLLKPQVTFLQHRNEYCSIWISHEC